ncbi:hypothetical protein [Limosilactobacillus sp.]|uniref:hypothetical protein n=1 Tax=Limosilactobacillus sp. TaxID=2773925 RepID=UPI003F112CD4
MTLSQSLTNLGNSVRAEKLLSEKLTIDEMVDLLSAGSDLVQGLGNGIFIEEASISKADDGFELASFSGKGLGRIAIPFKDNQPIGRTVAVYFQAKAVSGDSVTVSVGPVSAGKSTVKVKSSSMQGYFTTIKFTANNSLSLMLPDHASILAKDLRAWYIS